MRAATLDDRLEALLGPPGFQAGGFDEGIAQGTLTRTPFEGMSLVLVYDADGTKSGNFSNLLSVGTQDKPGEGS